MYVKSLTLKGFKSFADPVALDLQPGVNVVVGPNGSGKSNVIDAVAWVLGAQGARALRGGKMDDVIFAGTGKRAALGRAEVSLTIDNGDKRIPVDFSEVTITRTLFRTGESEYAINGVPCRLLDIQELLSDSGVGRQQHVIVSQGNLDAVLTARPEDRRMIIEEAAGVLKYRKRREKSQRRLESTEENLERLQDLVREVRQQMRPLQKQAEAAMRHDDVAAELRSIKLHVAGRDIEGLRHRRANAQAEAAGIEDREVELRAHLVDADIEVSAAEEAMASFREDDLGDRVERLESLYQRAKGMSALMAERHRGLERDLASSISQDVVAQLESDAANTRRELDDVSARAAELVAPFDELAHAENALAAEWLTFEEQWGEGLPVTSNEAAQLRGEASALRKNIDALRDEISRRRVRIDQLGADLGAARDEAASLEQELRLAGEASAALAAAAAQAAADLQAAQAELDAVEAEHRAAEQRLSVTDGRVEALTSALDASRARAGVERLAGAEGIVGTLADLVEIDDGYQAAFEAAAGEAMAAVVVSSDSAARDALLRLRDGDGEGAVLVLGHDHGEPCGAPEGLSSVETLRHHVRGDTAEVNRLLDTVLCCCVVARGDWTSALDVALEYPDLVVVTESGDRFSRNGWRIGAGGAGATVAAVRNAEAERDVARAAVSEAGAKLQAAVERRDSARAAEREASASVHENERRAGAAAAGLERAQSRVEAFQAEIDTITGHLDVLSQRVEDESRRLAEIDERLPSLEAAEATGEERARLWREERSVLEARSADVRKRRSALEVEGKALDERRGFLARRLEGLESRLEEHKAEVVHAAERRRRTEHAMTVVTRLRGVVDARVGAVASDLEHVRAVRNRERDRQREVSARLEDVRRRRAGIERDLLENGQRRQEHEVRLAEIAMRLDAVAETLERELQVDADTAIAAPAPELPAGQTAKQRMAELERELRQMGPVNPLALEEFKAVQERHEFLDKQLQDVQESRRELVRVIRAVDTEIVQTFKSAYDDVARNFADLFGTLFPGGAGNLRLTDPENLLETGIEIEAKPSGKNVRTLSLLSGGERSLAAMAFLFAVFRSRPSPFYLLDEVEAALDDINLNRFLKLVHEFRAEAQLVIVSHQKRTMEVADCLYGVSMQPGGSSKVVSERLHADLTQTA